MHIYTNVLDLQNALSTVTRAIAPRPAKKVLEGVLIDAADDEITLTCTDGALVIQSTIHATVNEPGRIVLPGKLLSELSRKLPASEVSIRSEVGNSVQIKCLSSNSRLSGFNPMEFPEIADIPYGTQLKIPHYRLLDMINRVVFSTSTDESKIMLTGCLMEIQRSELRIVALDGFRLAMQIDHRDYDIGEDKDMVRIIVPGRVMNELSKIMADEEENCELIFNSTHIKAIFGNSMVACSLINSEYLDYRKILPAAFNTFALVKKNDLSDAIERASLLAREGKTNIVKITLLEDQIDVYSKAEQGDVLEEIPAEINGDPIEIAFNAKYISDVIRNISDDTICLKFISKVSPCVIAQENDENYLYMILPVRVFS